MLVEQILWRVVDVLGVLRQGVFDAWSEGAVVVCGFAGVFISFFFISMGMLLDYMVFVEQFHLILFWLSFILLVKIAAGFLAGTTLKVGLRTSLMVGLALAQIGEFSFVLGGVVAVFGRVDLRNPGVMALEVQPARGDDAVQVLQR